MPSRHIPFPVVPPPHVPATEALAGKALPTPLLSQPFALGFLGAGADTGATTEQWSEEVPQNPYRLQHSFGVGHIPFPVMPPPHVPLTPAETDDACGVWGEATGAVLAAQ